MSDPLISLEDARDQWRSAPWWLKPVLPLYWAVVWLWECSIAIAIVGLLTAPGVLFLVALVYVPLFRPSPLMRKIGAWIVSWL